MDNVNVMQIIIKRFLDEWLQINLVVFCVSKSINQPIVSALLHLKRGGEEVSVIFRFAQMVRAAHSNHFRKPQHMAHSHTNT